MIASGIPRKEICAKLKVAPSTLTNFARTPRPRDFASPSLAGGRGKRAFRRDDALDLVGQGAPLRRTAERFGISRLRQVLNEARAVGDPRAPPPPGSGNPAVRAVRRWN